MHWKINFMRCFFMENNVNTLNADFINEAVEKNDSNTINRIKAVTLNNSYEIDEICLNNLLDLNWLQKLTPKSIMCFWDILFNRKYNYYTEGSLYPDQLNIWQSLSVKQLNNLCGKKDYYVNITNFIQKNRELDYGVVGVDYIDTEQCNLDKYFGEPIVSQESTSYPFCVIDLFWDKDFDAKWSSLNENAKKLLFRYAIKQLFDICNNVANQNDGMQSFRSLGGLLNSISFLIQKYSIDDDLSAYTDILPIRKLTQNAFLSDNLDTDYKNKILQCLDALAKFKQLGTKFQDNVKKVIELLSDNKKIDFEFYLDEIKNLNSDSIITKFNENWFSDCQVCSRVLENLSYQQINDLVIYKSDNKSGSKFISKLLKTICESKYIYDESSGDFLGFDKTAKNDFFGAQQIKKSISILVDVVENNMKTLDLKSEERNVTEYKFFSKEEFLNLVPEVKNIFVSELLNSFLGDLERTDEIYQTYHKNNCLPPDQMLAAINECYINFSEVLKSFSETYNNGIKIDLDVLEKLIFQLFIRGQKYLKPFLTKLMDLPGFDKSFVNYMESILPFCDSNLLDGNREDANIVNQCEYANIVNQAVANNNQDQIAFIKKLMRCEYSYFFHHNDYNFIKNLSYNAIITFGGFMSIRAINCLSKNCIKTMFGNAEHRKILEKVLESQSNELTIITNKYWGHDTEELEVLADYEFMEFGNQEQAQELPAWLLKINKNDNLQNDNFPQFTFQTLIIPDNTDSVFIAHDVNVRINKLLKELLTDIKKDDNNQENAEKYIDTKKMREVFVSIYCLIRKYANHHLEVRIDEKIISSIIEKTKKEDLNYLTTCFDNFTLFMFNSFGRITKNNFTEASEKCLDFIDFNDNEFLQRLESNTNLAETIFLSNKIQKLNINSLISKAKKLKSYPSCIVYLSNQQINDLATEQGGLKIIKHCLDVAANQNEIFRICEEADVFRFKHIEKKLNGITPQLKRLFIKAAISSGLKQLQIKTNEYIRNSSTTITRINGVVTGTLSPVEKAQQCIRKTLDAICVLMQNPAVTNDLNIEIDFFVLDALTNKIPGAVHQFYLQQLQRIIELPGWSKKTLYYLKQIIHFLSFGHLFSQNSLIATIRSMREQNINPQNPVPQMENDNLNIQ